MLAGDGEIVRSSLPYNNTWNFAKKVGVCPAKGFIFRIVRTHLGVLAQRQDWVLIGTLRVLRTVGYYYRFCRYQKKKYDAHKKAALYQNCEL